MVVQGRGRADRTPRHREGKSLQIGSRTCEHGLRLTQHEGGRQVRGLLLHLLVRRPRSSIPDLDRPIRSAGGQAGPIGTERHAHNLAINAVVPEAEPLIATLPALPPAPGWQFRLSSSLPVVRFQIFTVLSLLPETRRVPSGLKATLVTSLIWPGSVWISWPVVRSHTFRVSPPAARRLPS